MQKLRNGFGTVWVALAFCALAALTLGTATARAQSTYQFAIPTFSVYEDGTNVTIAVIRSGDTSVAGSVRYASSDNPPGPNSAISAPTPDDYTAVSGTLNFGVGEIVQTFNVAITTNDVAEFDELFTLTLSIDMVGDTIGVLGVAQVQIFDDDACFSFSQALYQFDENSTNVFVTVTRFPPSSAPSSVVLQTFNGTNGGAIAPGDYTSINTNLVFTNGQSSVQLFIPIIDDCNVETNAVRSNRLESIILVLTNAVGGRVNGPACTGGSFATLDILDNDTDAGQIVFTFVGPTSVMEDINPGLQPVRVRLSRLCGTNGTVTVDFEMFNDEPFAPANLCNGQLEAFWRGARNDYTFANSVIFANNLPGGTITWGNGDSQDKFIDIFPIDDTRVELDENIRIRLVRPMGGATIGVRRTYEVVLLNDDLPAGSADTSYNSLTILNPTPGANSTIYASVTYTDGTERTLVGGDFSAVNAVVRNGVARLTAAGAVDATFDPGSGADGFVSSIVLQPDGRVLVGGGFTSFDNLSRYGITRLNADGSLDTTFDIGAGANGSVHAIALQADGKVVIAGDFTSFNNTPRFRIARLNDDGSLDPTFSAGSGPDDVVYALAVQADGKILLGGAFGQVNGQFLNGVARLGTNGAVDVDWEPIAGADGTVYAITLQADGNALIGGAFQNYDGEMYQGIARLQASGVIDPTFNACRGMNGVVYAIALQADGLPIIGGDFTVYNDTGRANLARLLANGAIDTAFLDNYYNHAAPGTDAFVAAVSIQQDGNVIIGGDFSLVGGGWVPLTGYAPAGHTEIRFNYARVFGNITLPAFQAPFQWSTENSPGNLQLVQPAYTIDENVLGGTLAVTVQRINGGLGGVQVGFRTVDGSARAGVDYQSVTGTVLWADCTDGQRIIAVPILDNSVVDGNKTFFIELFQPESFGPIQTNQPALGFNCRAEIVIVDEDENRGVLGFSKPIFAFSESNVTATISVGRINGSEGRVTVQYQTRNGSATSPADYSTNFGTLTFQSGDTNKTFPVTLINDIASEFEENFSVRLFNAGGGATLGLTNATVLIFDNENGPGSISFTATDFVVNEEAGTASITLRRTSGANGAVSVELRTTDLPPGTGAARAGVDYGGVTNIVTFASGVTNQTVTIPLLTDRFVEGPETVALSLVPVSGASLGFINAATLTIQDDDAYGSLTFSATNYYVSEEGIVAVLDVLRTGGDAEEVTVDFLVVAGTAADTVDFTGTNGTLTFPDGVTVQTISVPIFNDGELEGNETIFLSLFNFSKATVGPVTNAVLNINDDEAQAVAAGSVDTSFNPVPGPDSFVNVIAIQPDGRVLAGGEFTAFGGVARRRVARLNIDGSIDATFNPGQGADESVDAIALQPDGKVLIGGAFTRIGNRNRGHIARLTSAGVLDTSFNPGSGADNPVYALALQPDGRVLLGGDFATFNGITRNGIARVNANGVIDAAFQPGTGANGTVVALVLLPDGDILVGGEFTTFNNLSAPYLVRLNADGSVDGGFSPTATPLNGAVRTIVVQPDGRIIVGGSFTAAGLTARPYIARLEADGTLDATFDPGVGPNSIVYSAALQSDGRVVIGGEFTSINGLIQNRIARLQSNGALDTSINFGTGANLFVAAVLLQTDASILVGGGFTQINGVPRNYIARLVGGEDVSPGVIQFIQAGYTVLESGTNVTITIARVLGSQGQVEVDLVSSDLGSAVGGIDYGLVNEHLIFVDGETIKTIVVGITNDLEVELNELFQLSLTNVVGGATLNEASATYVTIVNDDSALGFTVPAFNVNEKVVGGNVTVSVARSGATNDPVSVNYATVSIPGGALPGVDYTSRSGVLNFLPGQTNLSFAVPILDDFVVEGNESFSVILSNNTGSSIITVPLASVNIIDNDFSPGNLSFSLTAYSVNESNGAVTITIVRTNGTTGVASVDWSAGGGTALGGIDYLALGGVISLADGVSSASVTITILDDVIVEGNESFIVTISNPTGGAVISGQSSVVVTIEDDEFGPGSLDPTFNPGSGANNPVRSVAIAPDGKVVAGGEFTNFAGFTRGHLVRLNVDGSVDLGFDSSVGANGAVSAVGVFPDGRVAVGGIFTSFNGQSFNRVARAATNGLPDPSMTQGGGVNNGVNALITNGSASITVAGTFSQPRPGVTRFLADGGPDASFIPGVGPEPIVVHALAPHPSGGVVIGGGFSTVNGLARSRVAKLLANGLPDQNFNPPAVAGLVYAVIVQPDGKVLLAGSFTTVGGAPRGRVARLNANGSLDTSFDPGSGANTDVRAMALQADGRVIVAGNFTNFNGVTRGRIARLEATGALDPVFDPGRGADNTIFSVALEPDGKVVIGGSFTSVNGFARSGVARLNGDQPVVSFAAAGMASGGARLVLRTTPGGRYVIESTANFTNWSPVSTNVAAGYELIVADPTAHGVDWRFYRARQVPRP